MSSIRARTSFVVLLVSTAMMAAACSSDGDTSHHASTDAGSTDAASDARPHDAGADTASHDTGDDIGDAGVDTSGPDATPQDAGADTSTDTTDATDAGGDAAQGLPDGPSSERQTRVPRVAGDANAPPNGYWEYLPPGYGDGSDRPLLLFWHGLGENGNGDSDLDKVLHFGPPKFIDHDDWPSSRSFIVLSPQHGGGGCPSPDEIHDFLDYALANYDIDTSRIYLTGLSCGAIGSWNYLGKYTNDKVAAAVLIAGDGRGAWNRAGCDLGTVAIWAFHGDADGTVSPQGTIVPTDHLADCPSPPRKEVKATIYPGVHHNSWTRTYSLSAGHDIYTWLMQFSAP